MAEINTDCEIFISYHGNSNGGESSFPIAERLKTFFENHESRSFKCFLCRRENAGDFYDAINHALATAKHFILVACDKNELSNWVADEVKQFDALRKIGKKPGSVLNAYISGNIEIDDLIKLNTVFSTKDIARGDSGFNKLYDMICLSALKDEPILSLNFKKEDISDTVYLSPISYKFSAKLQKYVNTKNAEEINRKIIDNIIVFESYAIKTIFNQDCISDSSFIIFQTHNPLCLAEYLLSLKSAKQKKILLINPLLSNAVFLAENRIIPIPSVDDLQIGFKNKTITIKSSQSSPNQIIAFSVDNELIELPSHQYEEYGEIIIHKRKFENSSWDEETSGLSNARFCLYILNALYKYVVPNDSEESTILEEEIDFCSISLSADGYDELEVEKTLLMQRRESVIKDEYLLFSYYTSIKTGIAFGEDETKRLFASKYGDVAYKLKEYYNKHSTETLIYVLDKLYEFALNEKDSAFYSKYEYLMRILFEIFIYNIFILDLHNPKYNNLYNEICQLHENEFTVTNRLKLKTLICAYRKELIFGGHENSTGEELSNTIEEVLSEFDSCISGILITSSRLSGTRLKPELLLLYRQRCVVWEQCGDRSVNMQETVYFYSLWKKDCESAIDVANTFNCDKELLGCVYLNYASSLNRLCVINNANMSATLNECLKHLNYALELFKTCASERYVGYAYLHKSDCYEALLNLQSHNYINLEEIAPIAKEIRKNASHALNIFKNTEDNVAMCWSIRLFVKGKILLSDNNGFIDTVKSGLKSLKEALKYCLKSKFINGMASCVEDLTLYMKLVTARNLGSDLENEIKSIFFEEMALFSSIIPLIDLNLNDIMALQEQSEKLVSKLLH